MTSSPFLICVCVVCISRHVVLFHCRIQYGHPPSGLYCSAQSPRSNVYIGCSLPILMQIRQWSCKLPNPKLSHSREKVIYHRMSPLHAMLCLTPFIWKPCCVVINLQGKKALVCILAQEKLQAQYNFCQQNLLNVKSVMHVTSL